jgi:pimeloyl-ACP methyl ester carboxylesterase
VEDEGQRLFFEGRDGNRLAAEAWGPEDGPPVVLLHGGGQTRHAWGGTAEALADEGWRAIAVDQRGHGDSEWVADGDYEFLAFSSDVEQICAQLPQPPVLVGASLGGIASLMAVGDAKAPARGLVLVDVAVRLESEGVSRVVDFMNARPDGFESLEDAADHIAAYLPHRKRRPSVSGLAKNLRQGEDGRYRWHWDPRFMIDRQPRTGAPDYLTRTEDAARALRIPTLLVRGRLSDLLSEEGARHFLEVVPHARFADVSEAGHMVAGDRNDLFTEAVAGFLREELTHGDG